MADRKTEDDTDLAVSPYGIVVPMTADSIEQAREDFIAVMGMTPEEWQAQTIRDIAASLDEVARDAITELDA